MNVDEDIKLLGLKLTPRQYAACRALEDYGLQFCVDFGYENAERIWHDINTLNLNPDDIEFLSGCGIRA